VTWDNTLWKGVIGEGAVEHYADKTAHSETSAGQGDRPGD